jgi:hypothetical protein
MQTQEKNVRAASKRADRSLGGPSVPVSTIRAEYDGKPCESPPATVDGHLK